TLSAIIRFLFCYFFFQAEDGIRYPLVTGVQTCALPIFNLLNESGYLCDIPRAFLEVPNILDLADLDEGILRRVGTGARVVIANHRQRARGWDLSVKLHEFGDSRLAAPTP